MGISKDTPQPYYRPELDVLRFVAFLFVFLHHTLPETGDARVAHLLKGFGPLFDAFVHACGYGLSLFFTLSAFLICELLLRERESTGVVGIKQFYFRRILRIWPLYYFGLAIGIPFAMVMGQQHRDMAEIGWFAIFMGAWYMVAHTHSALPIEPLWSISVEEQFYLFAPWALKYFNRKSLYTFCGSLILVSNVWLYYLARSSASDQAVWSNCFVQYECFACGILLCLVLRSRLPNITAWQRVGLIFFGLCCWVYSCYGLHCRFFLQTDRIPDSWELISGYGLATLGCLVLLIAFLGSNSKIFSSWAIYLGRISFGLYVFHDFAIYVTEHMYNAFVAPIKTPLLASFRGPMFIADQCLALGLTVLVAALSYRYLERPFLKLKKRHAVIESEPI